MEGKEDTQKLQLIVEASDAQVFKISGDAKELLDKGSLQIAEVEKDQYILSVNEFKYSLSQEIPILAKRIGKNETLYILPDVEGHIGIHLPESSQNIDLIEGVLRDVCKLAFEDENIEQVVETPGEARDLIRQRSNPDIEKPIKEKVKPEKKDQEENKEGDDVNYISHYITVAGEFLKEGIAKIAVLTAGTINDLATYVSEKVITEGSEYKMWGITYKGIEAVKNLTDKAVHYRTSAVGGAMNRTSKIVFKLHSMFENSAAGKSIASTAVYRQAQDITSASIFASAGIYDAMSDAMDTLGGSFNQATTSIVTKRYGERAGKSVSNAIGSWQNLGNIVKGKSQGTVKSLALGMKQAKEEAAKALEKAAEKKE